MDPYNFDTGQGRCIEAGIESGQKRDSDGSVLADRKVLKVPVTFPESKKIFLSETKSQVRPILATHHHTNLEESSLVAPEVMASIDMIAGNLVGEVE